MDDQRWAPPVVGLTSGEVAVPEDEMGEVLSEWSALKCERMRHKFVGRMGEADRDDLR